MARVRFPVRVGVPVLLFHSRLTRMQTLLANFYTTLNKVMFCRVTLGT